MIEQPWNQTQRIGEALKVALNQSTPNLTTHLRDQMRRHVVRLEGLPSETAEAMRETEEAIVLPKADPDDPNQIANLSLEVVLQRTLDSSGSADNGAKIFRQQSCASCHTVANGQLPKGPHLVDIGKRYSQRELAESILDPGKKIAQGFDSWLFVLESGRVETGFVVQESAESVSIRGTDGLRREIPQEDIDERIRQEASMMPKGVVNNLTPEELADLIAWLQTLH